MNNPFIGMTAGAWMVFLLTCGVADFRWLAWMLWVPWLTFATLAPVVWWWKHRKPNPTLHRGEPTHQGENHGYQP